MIDIIGKNASIETYPKKFFDGRFTIGVNSAAALFKTSLAFSMHPGVIGGLGDMFPKSRIVGLKFIGDIGVLPADDEEDYPNGVDGLGSYIGYDRMVYLQKETVPRYVAAAVGGEHLHPYRINKTALHLCMYWCICEGHKEINMFGLNNTVPCMTGIDFGWKGREEEVSLTRRRLIREIILEAAKHGVRINWWKNYEEYLKGVLYYGDCD